MQWRIDGERYPKTKGFATERAQIAFAKKIAGFAKKNGTAALRLADKGEAREWRAFKAEIGDVPLSVVLACWHKWGKSADASALSVSELVPKYLALRDEESAWGKDARCHAAGCLNRFAATFGTRRPGDLSRIELRSWLFGKAGADGKRTGMIAGRKGKPIGAHAINNHRKAAKLFLDYCIREKWGVTVNEFDFIKPPKMHDGDPVVLPLRKAFEFFKANREEPGIARVALEAFGAVRYKTAGQIEKAGINFQGLGIRMRASIHKSGLVDGRSRYRQGHPNNLWSWLEKAPAACWSMDLYGYRDAKREAWIRANVRPDDGESFRNIWRHTFISYHLARFKNLPLTQYLAQHSNPEQTEEYQGLADETDAARYFMITPETVKLSWEDFEKLPIPRMLTHAAA